jgi:hypothetical protein
VVEKGLAGVCFKRLTPERERTWGSVRASASDSKSVMPTGASVGRKRSRRMLSARACGGIMGALPTNPSAGVGAWGTYIWMLRAYSWGWNAGLSSLNGTSSSPGGICCWGCNTGGGGNVSFPPLDCVEGPMHQLYQGGDVDVCKREVG